MIQRSYTSKSYWWMAWGILLCGPAHADSVSFDRDVRPILSSTCYQCHGPDAEARKGKLRLDTREGAMRMLAPGRWAGDPDRSEVMKRLLHQDPEERMPPVKSGKVITPEQVGILRT